MMKESKFLEWIKGKCPERWIRLKVVLFESSSLKVVAQRFSANFGRHPSCEFPFKILRHLVQLLAIKILIANADMKFIAM